MIGWALSALPEKLLAWLGLSTRIVFTVRVVYKSGYCHDFEATKFTISSKQADWEAFDQNNKPLRFGIDEVAAAWQIGARQQVFRIPKKETP